MRYRNSPYGMRIATGRSENGLSLIELMIGLAIGMIVVGGAITAFTLNSRNSEFTSELQSMQDNGRFGLHVIQSSIQMAGYIPTPTKIDPVQIDMSSDTQLTLSTYTTNDCSNASTAATDGIATNTYWYDSEQRQLLCQGSGDAIALIKNVDAMRLLYGIDDDSDGVPNHFARWNASINPETLVAIRIGFLIATGKPIRNQNLVQNHFVLGEQIDTNDRIVRHVYQTTVDMKNRLIP